ncbi:MAG: MurR/RpiR family transcriptional regulator [Coriobacteriaceae bacterium]|jgi:DNA-binding MurR/RpiR family transcriptional regulator|nr:MAG: MurR/RpiR family transcriptional regulator [Coriobacteriaceae bacterium]
MEPKSLLVLLKENRDYVSTSERDVIDFVLKDPERVVGVTIHELASMTFVSPSTISRLCRSMDIGGYKEFQRQLVYELATLRDSERTTIEDIKKGDSTKQTMFKVTHRNMESLAITEKLNDPTVIDACVDLMTDADTINLFGMGSSLLSARDLHYKLIRANLHCNTSDDWHMQLVAAKNMGPHDLAIAFSYSGRTQEVIKCVKEARRQEGKVIVVTRAGHDSEFVRLADHALYVASTEPVLRSSASASRISQLGLVDILFTAFVNKNYDRCAAAFEQNYIER